MAKHLGDLRSLGHEAAWPQQFRPQDEEGNGDDEGAHRGHSIDEGNLTGPAAEAIAVLGGDACRVERIIRVSVHAGSTVALGPNLVRVPNHTSGA